MDLIEMAVAELEKGKGPPHASKRTATQTGSQVRKGDRQSWLTHPPVRETDPTTKRRLKINKAQPVENPTLQPAAARLLPWLAATGWSTSP
jgi:hypothetical protein